MNDFGACSLKLLVVIANHGTANDKYLVRVIDEYRSMCYATHIVVLSNIAKDLGPDIEVIVGTPNHDPRSLPFGHRQVFADRLRDYDLFLYSEDDVLITQNNVEAFLRTISVLSGNELVGFLRFENGNGGHVSYPDVHWNYHWDTQSAKGKGGYTFAHFTNEHSACYLLTREQLRRALASGGFLVAPHRGSYDLLETAATDIYTQCGFTKLLCISHMPDFLVHHLPNKYVGRLGLEAVLFERQVQTLLKISQTGYPPTPLLDTNRDFRPSRFAKNYYEPVRTDLLNLIPDRAQNVLSIGCGWGATEESLTRSGKQVIAVPLDPVISACARARNVNVVEGDLDSVRSGLLGQRFDCLLLSNVLHLMDSPAETLASLLPLLSEGAVVITAVPNLSKASVRWRKWRGDESHRLLGDYARSGVHFTSHGVVRRWLKESGLKLERFADVLPGRVRKISTFTQGRIAPLLASEIVAVAVCA